MGRIKEIIIIRNLLDIWKANEGLISKEAIRQAEVEAIVDTGAAYLCLPPKVIAALGLQEKEAKNVMTANGKVKRKIFYGAEVTLKGRECEMQVMENDELTPPLIGYLLLEALDLVADPTNQTVIQNPEHNGEWVMDLY